MLIGKIGVNTLPQTSFRSNITFDIGGSQREGSCKIYYATSSDDREIYSDKTTVNKIGKKSFESSNDFIQQIVKKVKAIQKGNAEKIKALGYSDDENTLKSMTIFIPSYTDKKQAYYLPNHRDKADLPLKDLNFSTIKQRLIKEGVKIAPNMRFMLLQDAMGTGLAITKKLYQNGMLGKGKYYTACITGGGCGVANIEMDSDNEIKVKSTGSGYLTSTELQKVSKVGASAPAVCRNFCRAFKLDDETTDKILKCHKAEFALSDPIEYKYDANTRKLRTLLLATGKYEEVATYDSNKFRLEVKKEFKEDFRNARRNAIDKYCLAFARFAIIKKTECSNGLIITGPLAQAIDKAARKHYKFSVSQWVSYHLHNSFNTYELEKAQKTYDFQVICDKRFFLEDNTDCKELAHKAEFVAPGRYNWIKIKVDDLKNKAN